MGGGGGCAGAFEQAQVLRKLASKRWGIFALKIGTEHNCGNYYTTKRDRPKREFKIMMSGPQAEFCGDKKARTEHLVLTTSNKTESTKEDKIEDKLNPEPFENNKPC